MFSGGGNLFGGGGGINMGIFFKLFNLFFLGFLFRGWWCVWRFNDSEVFLMFFVFFFCFSWMFIFFFLFGLFIILFFCDFCFVNFGVGCGGVGCFGCGGVGCFLWLGFNFSLIVVGVCGVLDLVIGGGLFFFMVNLVFVLMLGNNILGVVGCGGGGGVVLCLFLEFGVDVFMLGEFECDEIVFRLGVEVDVILFFLIGFRFWFCNVLFVRLLGWFCFRFVDLGV